MDMGDCKSMNPESEGEENLIAALQHIVGALGSKKNLTNDMRKLLVNVGTQLSTISTMSDSRAEGTGEIEEQLNAIQEKIMKWESDQAMIWDSGPDEALDYLNTVNEAQKLIERLESLCLHKDDEEIRLLRRAHDVVQTAMARLEEEFRHILIQNRQPFEPEHMSLSFRLIEDDSVDLGSIVSFGDESVEGSHHRDNVNRKYIIDLVHPDVIPELRCIANVMFNSNYDQECSHTYTTIRKDALDECLLILEIEKLSIEDVLRMEWGGLNSKIKRWVRAMKIFVRVYLASEKCLSDQIFADIGPINSICFVEASKASMLQVLNFGEAICIGPYKPEKLVRILDMYEVLEDLLPDINALYSDEVGSSVRTESHEVLQRLADCVRATFLEFENAISSNVSTNPFAGGGIHHLTKYVMNYLRILTDYDDTLKLLLKDHSGEDSGSSSPNMSLAVEEESGSSLCSVSPMSLSFQAVASILESNLHDKSKLYKDASLQQFFMMNNIHYMAQKVKNSELRLIFGDKWIRKHNWKFQQHAMNYERDAWSSILSLLKDKGLHNPGSNSISKILLKERFRSFNLAFEEVYKNQTAWLITDLQLREDLQISTSLTVIQPYRIFVGRHTNNTSNKHIKYSAHDLENYILDLFGGSPKSLHTPSRR